MPPSQPKPSLEWLIDPTEKQTFFEQYWEKRPLVVRRNQSDYFSGLLSLDDVDRAITTLNLTYPNITLKNADREVSSADYTVAGALDVVAVYQLFKQGSTVVLAFLDTLIPALTSLCRGLESQLCFPLQTNAYLTPPGAQGAKPHYDTHDVFVLQVAGSKRWTIYGTPLELPLRGQDFDPAVVGQGPRSMDFELRAGDVAYIPRGVVHDARSSNDLSLHITLGVLCYTWADFLLELVSEASLNDSAFRKSLPPGFGREEFDRTNARETLHDLFGRLSAKSNLDGVLDRFTDQWIAGCPPLLRGQMGQISLVDNITSDSWVGARRDTVYLIRREGTSASIYACGRKISFPTHAEEAARFALREARFLVRELPGDLDEEGKVTLVRRLVQEGLMVVLEGPRPGGVGFDSLSFMETKETSSAAQPFK